MFYLCMHVTLCMGNKKEKKPKYGSRPITEVKQSRARSVLGWVTAWEHRIL